MEPTPSTKERLLPTLSFCINSIFQMGFMWIFPLPNPSRPIRLKSAPETTDFLLRAYSKEDFGFKSQRDRTFSLAGLKAPMQACTTNKKD